MMPKLWDRTIEAHRREVRDAILDATAALVSEHGLLSVTMSQVAAETGIGRATLYKYFQDVEAILVAWHQRQVTAHLEQLAEVSNSVDDAQERLEAVLKAYAFITHETQAHHDAELTAYLHRDDHIAHARGHIHDIFRDLIGEAAKRGNARKDVAPAELARYAAHALGAAARLPSKAAVGRLVAVVLAGLERS